MKNLFPKIAALTALASTSSFALFGIGIHYAPNYGSKVESANEQIYFQEIEVGGVTDTISASLERGESNKFQGFGLKFWIDALPFIDIEGTVNFQANTYPATLYYDLVGDDTGMQEIALRTPGGSLLPIEKKIDPAFGWMMVDLTALYPFFELPIPVIDWKFYAGGGVTYLWGTPLVSKSFAEKVVASTMDAAVAQLEGGSTEAPTADEIAETLIDAFKDEGYHSGFGGHVMVGTRIDLLIISIYANGKYHLVNFPDNSASGLTLELGGGFGI